MANLKGVTVTSGENLTYLATTDTDKANLSLEIVAAGVDHNVKVREVTDEKVANLKAIIS